MFSPENLIGKQIDQFRLDQYIARGAMGIVYKAFDTVLVRTVALKLISKQADEDLSTQELAAREETRKRLIQEAKAAGRLSHPNIITIHSYGETEEFDYICMEYISGKTLAQIIQQKKVLSPEEAVPIFTQVVLALEAASREQIVHRDIKPSNIMITEDDRVKVMDFGIAKLPSLSMTTTGTVLGTPYYMSPEQISGQKVDTRSDIFSVGAVFYQALTGDRPFEAESTATLIYKIVQTDPVPAKVLNIHIPPTIGNIITKALAKDPAQRYQTPSEMLQALRAVAHPGVVAARDGEDATVMASASEYEATIQVVKPALETPHPKPGPPLESAPSKPLPPPGSEALDQIAASEPPPSPPKTEAPAQAASPEPPPKPAKAKPADKKAEPEGEKEQPEPAAPLKAEPAGKTAQTPPSAARAKTQTPAGASSKHVNVKGLVAVLLVVAALGGLVLWRQEQWPFGSKTPLSKGPEVASKVTTPTPTSTPTTTPKATTTTSPSTTSTTATAPATSPTAASGTVSTTVPSTVPGPAATPDQQKTTVDDLLAQAKSQWDSDPANAQELLQQAVTLDPNNFAAIMQLARLLTVRKDFQSAIGQYQNAMRINGPTADIHFNLGYIYLSQGDFSAAIQNYERCLALAPPYRDEVLTNLGISHFKRSDFTQAQPLFKEALDLNPKNELARSYLKACEKATAATTSAPPVTTSPRATAAIPQRTAIRVEGKYSVEGVNPNGSQYHGTAIIGRKGKNYVMSWNIAKQKLSGYGSLSGNVLKVHWSGSGVAGGVVTYTIMPDGVLRGVWAKGSGSETLIPAPNE